MANMKFTAANGKSIIFDDFVDNTKEYDSYWATMCPACYNKHKDILGKRAGDKGEASGTCSVKGCQNEADYYVDYDKNEVSFLEDVKIK